MADLPCPDCSTPAPHYVLAVEGIRDPPHTRRTLQCQECNIRFTRRVTHAAP